MNVVIAALCLCGLALGLPAENDQRERRQIGLPVNCQGTNLFTNVPNPCVNNPLRKGYFPYPGDGTKAIQCDNFGRMYIIQCPVNTVFNLATTSCISPIATTNRPTSSPGNPCTAGNLAAGRLYFPVPNDNTRFIECDLQGNVNILSCPAGLIWNEDRLSCVYANTAGLQVTPTSYIIGGNIPNPCRTTTGRCQTGFFSHPNPAKFIQCDLACDAYLLTCPAGLVWNEFSKTCVSTVSLTFGTG